MLNFSFVSPTRLVVGRDTHKQTGELIRQYGGTKALVHHDSGYVKTCGLVDEIIGYIKEAGVEVVELGGVVPNPRLDLVYEGIDLCRKEGVDFILAIGGGSTIDSAKAIAIGMKYDGDVWDMFIEDDGVVRAVETLHASWCCFDHRCNRLRSFQQLCYHQGRRKPQAFLRQRPASSRFRS